MGCPEDNSCGSKRKLRNPNRGISKLLSVRSVLAQSYLNSHRETCATESVCRKIWKSLGDEPANNRRTIDEPSDEVGKSEQIERTIDEHSTNNRWTIAEQSTNNRRTLGMHAALAL